MLLLKIAADINYNLNTNSNIEQLKAKLNKECEDFRKEMSDSRKQLKKSAKHKYYDS